MILSAVDGSISLAQGRDDFNKELAESVSSSQIQVLTLSYNDTESTKELAALLLNLHSTSLRILNLRQFFDEESYKVTFDSLEADRQRYGSSDTPIPSATEVSMDLAAVVAAFVRACANARVTQLLLGLPFIESSMANQGKILKSTGCSALVALDLAWSSLGTGGMSLIKGVWNIATQRLTDHPNPLVAQALPGNLSVDFTGCDQFVSATPTAETLQQVFSWQSKVLGPAQSFEELVPETKMTLCDPLIQILSRSTVEQAEHDAFAAYLAEGGRTSPYMPAFNPEVVLTHASAAPFRSAPFSLLAAARILACRVSSIEKDIKESGHSSQCSWLALPIEVRRACLAMIPTLSIPTSEDLRKIFIAQDLSSARLETMQRHSVLSNNIVGRILSYAADRRTIGYGVLPEATAGSLRLASDADAQTQPSKTVLGEFQWSFGASHHRWAL